MGTMLTMEVDIAPDRSLGDLEELYREVAPGLWRAIYAYAGGQRDVADDAVAEAFTRSLEAPSEIRNPKAWLYRVAFRAASAELKAEARHPGGHERRQHEPDPDDLHTVLEAVRSLPPNQRAAIVLHYRLDLSVRQIADALGISSATVRVHLHRGRNRLRDLLGQETSDA